jgi:hypothetical protein
MIGGRLLLWTGCLKLLQSLQCAYCVLTGKGECRSSSNYRDRKQGLEARLHRIVSASKCLSSNGSRVNRQSCCVVPVFVELPGGKQFGRTDERLYQSNPCVGWVLTQEWVVLSETGVVTHTPAGCVAIKGSGRKVDGPQGSERLAGVCWTMGASGK